MYIILNRDVEKNMNDMKNVRMDAEYDLDKPFNESSAKMRVPVTLCGKSPAVNFDSSAYIWMDKKNDSMTDTIEKQTVNTHDMTYMFTFHDGWSSVFPRSAPNTAVATPNMSVDTIEIWLSRDV